MRASRWTGYGLALGTLFLLGCAVTRTGTSPDPIHASGSLKLFDNPSGYGALEMRVVDQRRGYGTQAIVDADAFDEVQIRLGGSKLSAPRLATMSANPSHQYASDKLGMLPPGSDYNLVVSLASKSVMLGGPVLVGQGGVDNIQVLPGSTRSVTVVINTVGDILLRSNDYMVAHGSAEVAESFRLFGFPEVLATSPIAAVASFSQDPAAPARQTITHIRMQLTDGDGNILSQPDGQPLASASVTSSVTLEGEAIRPFVVPPIANNEAIAWLTVYGIHVDPVTQSEAVISTKTRGILMLKGATLSVDMDPQPPQQQQ